MSNFIDYPYNPAYSQAHTDVGAAGMRSNKALLESRLREREQEVAEIKAALAQIDKVLNSPE